MITAVIDAGQHYCQAVSDLWQWDYGQTLRIQGVKIPAAVEVQFSTTERIGETVTRIGVTQEGVTEVPIPDTLLEGGGTTQDYTIYAFVYIENGDSGKTEYRVSMKVRARPKPEAHATPEEGELFRQAIVAVAESADRAESARKSAEASADEAKTSKENAETAVKNAEAFKTEAETARSGAVRAATESTDAKNSAEKSRAAAEKAKQDAEAAKVAADADKEAAEAAQAKAEAAQKAAENAETEAETAKNDAVQAKEAAEKAKSGTAADREVAEAASKAAQVSAISAEKSAERAETAKEEIQESADQIQKNTEDIAGLEETVSTAGISVTEAGTGIVVPECTGGKLQGLKMYGKSEQVQYSGKNLFNVSDTTNNILTKNGIKINEVDQQNGIIKAEFSQPYQQLGVMINSSANTTYTLSFKQKNSKNDEIEVRSYYVKNDVMGDSIKQVVISSEEASFTFTVLNDSYIVVFFRPKGNYSSSDTNVCEFTNIQLERNASSTDFEPYVGGKPSPSPDYPQEIKYVENPTLMIHTKNIVKDVYVIETTTQYSSALLIDADIQGDTEYMLSFIAPEGLRVYVNENLCSYKLIKGTGKIQSVPIKTIKTISKDNVNQFNTNRQKWMLLKIDKDNTVKSKFDKIQLEKGNVATTYESYGCKILTLPYQLNAIPVSSDGNYTDEEG